MGHTERSRVRGTDRGVYTDSRFNGAHSSGAHGVCVCVAARRAFAGNAKRQHTLYVNIEKRLPEITMSHCVKCHRVPVRRCLSNCHNVFNDTHGDTFFFLWIHN